jgi:hypothetical protein
MRILEPMNEQERADAIREAAMKPEIFDRIVNQFGGKLPGSDEPIRSFLIRTEGFSPSGADELIDTLRETLSALPVVTEGNGGSPSFDPGSPPDPHHEPGGANESSPLRLSSAVVGELITLPLGQNCKAELRMVGEVTAASYGRLIKHLELLREIAAEEGG